jgi:hypothetical protein
MKKYLLLLLFVLPALVAGAQDSMKVYVLRGIKGDDTAYIGVGQKVRVTYYDVKGLRDRSGDLLELRPGVLVLEGFQGRRHEIALDSVTMVKRQMRGAGALYAGGGVLIGIGGIVAALGAITDGLDGRDNRGSGATAGLGIMVAGGGMITAAAVSQGAGKYQKLRKEDGWVLEVVEGKRGGDDD